MLNFYILLVPDVGRVGQGKVGLQRNQAGIKMGPTLVGKKPDQRWQGGPRQGGPAAGPRWNQNAERWSVKNPTNVGSCRARRHVFWSNMRTGLHVEREHMFLFQKKTPVLCPKLYKTLIKNHTTPLLFLQYM